MRYVVRTKAHRSGTDFWIYDNSDELAYKLKPTAFSATWTHFLTDSKDAEIFVMRKIGKWRLTYEFFQNGHLVAELTEHGWLRPFLASFRLTADGRTIYTIKRRFRNGYNFISGKKRVAKFVKPFFRMHPTHGHLYIDEREHEQLIISAFGVLHAVDAERESLIDNVHDGLRAGS